MRSRSSWYTAEGAKYVGGDEPATGNSRNTAVHKQTHGIDFTSSETDPVRIWSRERWFNVLQRTSTLEIKNRIKRIELRESTPRSAMCWKSGLCGGDRLRDHFWSNYQQNGSGESKNGTACKSGEDGHRKGRQEGRVKAARWGGALGAGGR